MRIARILAEIAAILVLCFCAIDPGPRPVLEKRIDALFAEWDRPDSPGCALGVIRDGRFIYRRGYGMANLEDGLPITSESVFRIGSTSKQFTAACLALLEEDGTLSLDDPIRKFFPEMPAYAEKITIRHLIHHTSGIRDYLTLWSIAGEREDDFFVDGEVVELLARQKELNFEPGNEHLYSNSGYFLLSQLVLRVTGKTLRTFAEERIFGPLGMSDTHFHDDHTMIVKNRAVGYAPKEDDGFQISMTTLDMVGDGGVFTTVEDLSLWDQNFYLNKLGKGGQTLLDRIQTRGVLNSGEKLEYAFGLGIGTYRGLKTVSHGGAFVGYRADMIRFPDQKFTVICLSNLSTFNPTGMARKVADIYLAGEFSEEARPAAQAPGLKKSVVKPTAEELDRKTGLYYSKDRDSFWRLVVEDGKLVIRAPTASFPLSPMSPALFSAEDLPFSLEIEFREDFGGNPVALELRQEGVPPLMFERIVPFEPSETQLRAYAGEYYSDEVRAAYRIILQEGRLRLEHANPFKDYPREPLDPVLIDRFQVGGLKVNFHRSASGVVESFTLDAGRVKNIRFERR